MPAPHPDGPKVGRYLLLDEIASGGMAVVHLGHLVGPVGFARMVAIKRLHPHLASDPEFVTMFLDEARLAARIRHPHVVSTLDVVAKDGQLSLVMDYVHGDSLAALVRSVARRGKVTNPRVAVAIMTGVLYGLHAAHEATSETGEHLGIVHRDISPQNVIVGADGMARVLDFGIAKAVRRLQTTREGQLKGKLQYMAPEQVLKQPMDRRADIYAASVVLWELLTGEQLFSASDGPAATVKDILDGAITPPSQIANHVPSSLDAIVLRGTAFDADDRFSTAVDMGVALQHALTPAAPPVVGQWVLALAGERLSARAERIAEIESEVSGASNEEAPNAAETLDHESLERAEAATEIGAGPQLDAGDRSEGAASLRPGDDQVGGAQRRFPFGWLVAGGGLITLAAIAVAAVFFWGIRGAASRDQQPHGRATARTAELRPHPTDSAAISSATPETAADPPSARTGSGRATSNKPRKPKPDCNPPYTIDENRIRRYKPECL